MFTVQEFKEKLLKFDARTFLQTENEVYDAPELKSMRIPTRFDWRTKGAVTKVKDQVRYKIGSDYTYLNGYFPCIQEDI